MKKLLAILLLLLFTIQCVGATDIYTIDDVRNSKTSIHFDDEILSSYIDYRNIETEADSGGYIAETKEYILPHDLGLGKHRMEILTSKGTTTYDFYIVKEDEDTSIYDDYTPYYYEDEIDDETIEEDYNTFNYLHFFSDDTGTIEEYEENNIEPLIISINPKFYKFSESLTSGEIIS